MAMINMHEAKTRLSDLVARAEAGEEIVIARRNRPVVRLVPVEQKSSSSGPNVRASDDSEQMPGMAGFAEDGPTEYDGADHRSAFEAGRRFTAIREGRDAATLAPEQSKPGRVRGFGMLAHMPAVPDEAFFEPLPDEELRAWEGAVPDDPETPRA